MGNSVKNAGETFVKMLLKALENCLNYQTSAKNSKN